MKQMIRLLVLLMACWALPAVGADGDACLDDSDFDGAFAWGRVGVWKVTCDILCDQHVAATADTCSEFDTQAAARDGIPDRYIFTLQSANSCDAGYEAAISTNAITGSTESLIVTLNAANDRAVVDGQSALLDRYINIDTVDAGCDITGGTGLTVLLRTYRRLR